MEVTPSSSCGRTNPSSPIRPRTRAPPPPAPPCMPSSLATAVSSPFPSLPSAAAGDPASRRRPTACSADDQPCCDAHADASAATSNTCSPVASPLPPPSTTPSSALAAPSPPAPPAAAADALELTSWPLPSPSPATPTPPALFLLGWPPPCAPAPAPRPSPPSPSSLSESSPAKSSPRATRQGGSWDISSGLGSDPPRGPTLWNARGCWSRAAAVLSLRAAAAVLRRRGALASAHIYEARRCRFQFRMWRTSIRDVVMLCGVQVFQVLQAQNISKCIGRNTLPRACMSR